MKTTPHEDPLDQSLQSLVANHGYSKVLNHLARFEDSQSRPLEPLGTDPKSVDPRYLESIPKVLSLLGRRVGTRSKHRPASGSPDSFLASCPSG